MDNSKHDQDLAYSKVILNDKIKYMEDFYLEIIAVSKLLVAALLGGVIGFERERDNKDAGIRTYAAVCVGACLFVIIAAHLADDKAAISRVIAAVITGLGFLGAGIIFKHTENRSIGLTTSATLWCTASVGMAVALSMFLIAIVASGILFFLLSLHHYSWYKQMKKRAIENHNAESDQL